ncbi:MAG: hypothetical protein PVI56_09640 [Gammaproteobacteria bacterium]
MAQASFQVESYQYYDWSSRKRGKTNLILHGTGGQTCSVWFVEDETADLPEAAEIAPNYYSFYYHHYQLPHLIDMLRNEGPVYVYFNNEMGFNNSRIATTDEPVGEGEETS